MLSECVNLAIDQPTKLLRSRDHKDDLALRRMGLIICKKLAGGAAAEFLEFLCQLARNAKLQAASVFVNR
jgi:hypothetical protein